MKKIALAAAMLVSAIGAPAAAQTYSLAGDFGSTVFQYGSVGAGNAFTAFTPSDCSNIGVSGLCYRGNDTYQVEFQRTADALLIHPGPGDGQNSMVLFTAQHAGVYTFSTTLTRDDTGDGVNVFTYNSNDSGLTSVGRIDAGAATFLYAGSQFLNAGQTVGIGIDRGGAGSTYFNDSTLISGTIASVPEPATWALMILGFGAVGGAMRRRSTVKTAARFA